MKTQLRGLLRLVAFLLGFGLLLLFASFHFIQTDTFACLTLKEMQERDDIELAIVGSSIVQDHFNPAIIREETGLNAFDVTVPSASIPACIAMVRELLETNQPDYIVLVAEPYNFQTAKESTEAYYKLAPFLRSPANLIDYYLRTCKEDGFYLDRLLMFREFGAKSLSDIAKTFRLRYFPDGSNTQVSEGNTVVTYQGSGYVRYETDERVTDVIRNSVFREYTGYRYELFDRSKAHLLEFKRVCEEGGAKLLVAIFPNHTVHALAEPDFLYYNQSLMDFCAEQNIPCFNFGFAKPALMPNLDDHYFDLYHMVGEGGDLLTESFCRVFNAHTQGQNVDDLFYPDMYAYQDSIDFITNTWVEQYNPSARRWNPARRQKKSVVKLLAETQDVFLANSNHGPTLSPEYRFVIRHEDGSETLLQDFGVDTLYACEPGALDGKTLRVYARAGADAPIGDLWYDLTINNEEVDNHVK